MAENKWVSLGLWVRTLLIGVVSPATTGFCAHLVFEPNLPPQKRKPKRTSSPKHNRWRHQTSRKIWRQFVDLVERRIFVRCKVLTRFFLGMLFGVVPRVLESGGSPSSNGSQGSWILGNNQRLQVWQRGWGKGQIPPNGRCLVRESPQITEPFRFRNYSNLPRWVLVVVENESSKQRPRRLKFSRGEWYFYRRKLTTN